MNLKFSRKTKFSKDRDNTKTENGESKFGAGNWETFRKHGLNSGICTQVERKLTTVARGLQ